MTIPAFLCYASMLYAAVCAMIFYRRLERSLKILAWLLCTTFVIESGAFVLARTIGNNVPLYNLFLLAQFFLTAAYFNYRIDTFRKHNTGIWIGCGGTILGIANIILLQSLHRVGSNFLLFAGICIMTMSLYSFARDMLIRDEDLIRHRLRQCPHFWVSVSLTFFWSTSFLLWGLYEYFTHYHTNALPVVHIAIRFVNVLTYTAIGTAIFRYHLNIQRYDARR